MIILRVLVGIVLLPIMLLALIASLATGNVVDGLVDGWAIGNIGGWVFGTDRND
jgi:hypothetical protein